MRIIKHPKEIERKCKHCKCVFLFTNDETTVERFYVTIDCPSCKKTIYLSTHLDMSTKDTWTIRVQYRKKNSNGYFVGNVRIYQYKKLDENGNKIKYEQGMDEYTTTNYVDVYLGPGEVYYDEYENRIDTGGDYTYIYDKNDKKVPSC